MKACTRCLILYPRESFGQDKRGRTYRSCPECRSEDGDMMIKKRQCHGTPGHVCKKMISDYRCANCWARIRGGGQSDNWEAETGAA